MAGPQDWRRQWRESRTSPDDLAACLPVERDAVAAVARTYPLRVPRAYLQLIRSPQDSFWRRKSEHWVEVMNYEGRLFRCRDA